MSLITPLKQSKSNDMFHGLFAKELSTNIIKIMFAINTRGINNLVLLLIEVWLYKRSHKLTRKLISELNTTKLILIMGTIELRKIDISGMFGNFQP